MRRLAAATFGLLLAACAIYYLERRQLARESGNFRLVPDLRYTLTEPELGRRGYSEGLAPQPKGGDVRRFLAVGDSLTFGVGVGPREAWPGTLRELLGMRHTEVFNFGVAGWDAEQVARLLETRAERWSPDLVIWGTYANDLFPTAVVKASSSGDAVYVDTKVVSGARILPEKLGEWLLPRSALFRHVQGVAYERALAAKKVPPSSPERYGAAVDRVLAWSESTGIPVLVVAIPPHATLGPCDTEPCASMKAWYPALTTVLRQRGAAFVDIAAAWTGKAPFPGVGAGADPDHPNAAGHRIIAETLAPLCDALIAVPVPTHRGRRAPRPDGSQP